MQMSPIDWAKRPFQKYADFSGRAPRPEYWWYTLAVVILSLVANILDSILGLTGMVGGIYGPLALLVMLGTLVPSLAAGVRRLHDTNRSGWWMLLLTPYAAAAMLGGAALAGGATAGIGAAALLMLVGLVCAIVLLIFLALAGTPGKNRFGADPYGDRSAAAATV